MLPSKASLILCGVVATTACRDPGHIRLETTETLRKAFNKNADKTRVIMLLSPS